MHPGILTETLNHFLQAFGAGWLNLQPAITWLTGTLLGIEILMLGLWWALGGGEQLVALMKKLLYLGIWLWIVRSFPMLADAFVTSLIRAGRIAGGGGGPSLFDPSNIIEYGLRTTAPLAERISSVAITEITSGILLSMTYLGIMLAYILIAWQIFYAVLEFNLLAAVVGILLPFGFLEQTKFLAEKSIGAIVSSGVKLMVLAFIMAVIEPTLSVLVFSGEMDFTEVWSVLLTVGAIAFLAWNAPGIASGVLAGSPSLSAGTAVQNAIVGGTGAVLAGMGAYAAARMAATRAGSLGAASRLGGWGRPGGGAASKPPSGPPSDPNAPAGGGLPSAPSSGRGGRQVGAQGGAPPGWVKTALHGLQAPEESRPSGGSASPTL